MDRITIILGALGVGIGFGLQELTNSLVSGLIIAFEKPVNVGDIVEVAGQSGTMKSSGFRSSVLSTWDGADVIIPNGTLLSSNLINWTMSDDKRRVEVAVGVAYGTDLQLTHDVLLALLLEDERILKHPEPTVRLVKFNDSSVDFKIYFWVIRIGEWISIRSDIILAVDQAFKKHNIVIPFPQQDIHIHSNQPSKALEPPVDPDMYNFSEKT
jgi:small-conductance mechanosensitive channel